MAENSTPKTYPLGLLLSYHPLFSSPGQRNSKRYLSSAFFFGKIRKTRLKSDNDAETESLPWLWPALVSKALDPNPFCFVQEQMPSPETHADKMAKSYDR